LGVHEIRGYPERVFEVLELDDSPTVGQKLCNRTGGSLVLSREQVLALTETIADLGELIEELPDVLRQEFNTSSLGQIWMRLADDFGPKRAAGYDSAP
jgi:hypothetical protein